MWSQNRIRRKNTATRRDSRVCLSLSSDFAFTNVDGSETVLEELGARLVTCTERCSPGAVALQHTIAHSSSRRTGWVFTAAR
jgi:hypothetical protein